MKISLRPWTAGRAVCGWMGCTVTQTRAVRGFKRSQTEGGQLRGEATCMQCNAMQCCPVGATSRASWVRTSLLSRQMGAPCRAIEAHPPQGLDRPGVVGCHVFTEKLGGTLRKYLCCELLQRLGEPGLPQIARLLLLGESSEQRPRQQKRVKRPSRGTWMCRPCTGFHQGGASLAAPSPHRRL